jgi:hypothetical protein
MLQLLYMDGVKVDRDVARVVRAMHVCFQVYVLNILSIPEVHCKCFIWMLHMHSCCKHMFQVFSGVLYICLRVFYLNVAYVYNGFQIFLGVFVSV